jgi:hypothetical protein
MVKLKDYEIPKAPRISRFAKGRTYTIEGIKENNKAPQESYLLALVEMLKKLEDNALAYYKGMEYQRTPDDMQRGVTFGEKWDKVWVMRNGERASIICFIDADTGEVYKPAGVNKPYPKVRANIFEPASYEHADPHGGWLYAGFDAEAKRRNGSLLFANKPRSTKEILEHGESK